MTTDRAAAVIRATLGSTPSGSGWYRVNCPFCLTTVGKRDRSKALAVSASSGWFKCWRCAATGFADELAEGDEYEPVVRESIDEVPEVELPAGCLPLWGEVPVGLHSAIDYLDGRGVGAALRAHLRPSVCVAGRYRGRIIMPVMERGRRVGWVARALRETPARYLYPDEMERGEVLFGGDGLSAMTDDPILPMEGVFDAAPYFPDALAFLGKPSPQQLRRLVLESKRPLVWALDGDARRESWAWSGWCKVHGLRSTTLRLPPCEDPGSLDRTAVMEAARESARTGSDLAL